MTADDDLVVAAIASQIVGTWSYSDGEEPTGVAYLHFSDDGRFFQFVYYPDHPEKRIPVRLWYSVESSAILRLRSNGSPEGWTSHFGFDGAILTLTSSTRRFPCSRLFPNEIPEWFLKALNKQLFQS
jgi:hypothetical protein